MILIGVLRDECVRGDLVEFLYVNVKGDFFYFSEDYILNFYIFSLMKVFSYNGVNQFYYLELIWENSGFLDIIEVNL